MKLIEIQAKVLESGFLVFSKVEFKRLLGISKIAAQKLLERYTKKGLFVRLKGGLYALKNKMPSSYFIANKLYEPSYISFETALSYYNIIPEIVYSHTSVTTRTTRSFVVNGQNFIYHKIKRNAFTGYKLIKVGDEKIQIAEKEKALADYFYYIFLKKKTMNDRLNIKNINKKKLFSYVSLFGKQPFLEWIKNVIRTTN
ncbi:hypothetical protein A2230_02550 [candidate division WOR-1 bacterium RIFOXYA2_FULL_36_21]|uniref:AbiEi antitoxin C-terminal domain-containing protein n=1 Tax=candidate division WOR-1 bacterium RIFOXYB2_FULL_36_35 TaxID=1802578 RepID=A0A1F4S6X5_UNCSA|nr:MAG: hypothetical protein A2230_02550 [candidate division WOR-1 bacterium RIFOXYA2_FULL_36_21]OGC16186.1 MAG: hypothetical protein A2290_02910 [candidate division WOR-1 bacterium RIFOXYB2_FULL_36_35]OGC16899.1 MAG: hypothetical protein A2282_00590 [candidate division WOR-1 bacterium RIFOXYA12_FULL_36_13]